jgi:plastocyanin
MKATEQFLNSKVFLCVSAFVRFTFLLALALFAAKSPAATPYKSITVKDGGTISGVVKLEGVAPKLETFDVQKDNDWCGKKKSLPRLVLGKNNGVRNTVISLEGIQQGVRFESKAKAILEQKRCEYQPHVVLLPSGANLEIVNNDAVLHNVHAFDAQAKTMFNIAQPVKGLRFPVKSSQFKAGEIYETTCDAGHPWMSAYVVVAEHPYYAVTDAEGKFELRNVPPGTYKLKMWHEGVNTTRVEMENGKPKLYTFEKPYEEIQEVTVSASGSVSVDFKLALSSNSLTQR